MTENKTLSKQDWQISTQAIYRLHALRGTVQEAAKGCLLVNGRGRRNVRRFEQQPKQGGFARAQTTHDLDNDNPNT